MENQKPLEISRQGWVFAGGRAHPSIPGGPAVGQLYAEFQIPFQCNGGYPVVMIHGGFQSGTNFTGTPDGREGWAQHFLRRGYPVYVVDQIGRGRAAYNEHAYGPLLYPTEEFILQRFTAFNRFERWPQAHLHTQFPGTGLPGDPIFDDFYASQVPSVADFALQQALMKEAGVALLDKIGKATLLVHSQAATFAWPIAQERPELVHSILAVEPNGPPLHDIENIGAPDWFRDKPRKKISGLGDIELRYDPPLSPGEALEFERRATPSASGRVCGWMQKEPARKLTGLDKIPVLVITAEASYHAPYDDCTVDYLQQAGVMVDHIYLADEGLHGNGHMMMIEENNGAISDVMMNWLEKRR